MYFLEITFKAIDEINQSEYGGIMEALSESAKKTADNVLDNIRKAQEKQKETFDKKERNKLKKLEKLCVGDDVLVYDSCRKRKKNGGMLPSFNGVYKISKISQSGNFTLSHNGIDLPGSHKRDKLKKYKSGKFQNLYTT